MSVSKFQQLPLFCYNGMTVFDYCNFVLHAENVKYILCMQEKMAIIKYSHADPFLNRRNEHIFKCRHEKSLKFPKNVVLGG